MVIEFGKEDEPWARKFLRDCAQRVRPLNMKHKKDVHPSTLQAWVRKRLDDGDEIPMEKFGVYRQRMTQVTMPK